MTNDGTKHRPERAETDESLRTERAGTDRALAEQQAAIERHADVLLHRARQAADAVLSTARDRADDRREQDGHATAAIDAPVAVARIREDEVLRAERAAADETLRRERQVTSLALSRLLPLEREKTDRHLLTERVRSDDAVSNRDDFLSIVSHDLRNLLGGIAGSADVLAERSAEGTTGEQIRAGAARIRRYAARMNRLIGDLVDVASIDAGRLAVTPVPGDAAALVAEAVETFQSSAAAKQLGLQMAIGAGPLIAPFDHGRLLQVLFNLLANAIKFTSEGGRIWVRAERDEAQLRLSVGDTGPGIAGDMLESVFQRFWQAGKNDQRGLGLGLYISKCLVEAHGGTLWAESQLGEGSTFTFTVPLAQTAGVTASEPVPANRLSSDQDGAG